MYERYNNIEQIALLRDVLSTTGLGLSGVTGHVN